MLLGENYVGRTLQQWKQNLEHYKGWPFPNVRLNPAKVGNSNFNHLVILGQP